MFGLTATREHIIMSQVVKNIPSHVLKKACDQQCCSRHVACSGLCSSESCHLDSQLSMFFVKDKCRTGGSNTQYIKGMTFSLLATQIHQPVFDAPMLPIDSPFFPGPQYYRKLCADFVQGAQAPSYTPALTIFIHSWQHSIQTKPTWIGLKKTRPLPQHIAKMRT